jgi:hypothetical protein
MRKLLLVLVMCLWGLWAFPGDVDIEKAKIIALNWINSQAGEEFTSSDIYKEFTKFENNVPIFHIISFQKRGWVIISGSDAAEPVIAYSVESRFETDSLPPQVGNWMGIITEQIQNGRSKKIIATDLIRAKWSKYSKPPLKSSGAPLSAPASQVGPLLTTTWNQNRYYNELSPADPSSSTGNGHVWVGCVATAMAQVMRYWEYPLTGMGSYSYNHSKYGVQSANFGATSYNWSAMPNKLTAQNYNVQLIGYHCAVSVDMDFGPGSSGAYLDAANRAFYKYFKYNTTVFESQKNRWDDSEWKALMKRDLDSGRPIVYSGYNASYTSGHAWVCDGYSGDYFHFNWGWGGTYDGNYLLTALNPGSSNFSSQQAALFGLEPAVHANISIPFTEGFEASVAGFSFSGVHSIDNTTSHTGQRSLKLGNESISYDASNSASLCFIVPDDASLDFWVKRVTPQVSASNQQIAMILPQWGETPLLEIFNGDYNDTNWVNFNIDLRPFQGQIVRLVLVQKVKDVSRKQWMFVDNVAISGTSNNLPPYVPSNPSPSNGQEYVSMNTTLRWNGGDPNGDKVTYNLYFGETNNPPLIASLSENNYVLPKLKHATKYYWKIESSDSELTTASPLWSFTTMGIPPDVGTCGVENVTSSSFEACGQILNDNGTIINSKGICYSWTQNPSLSTNYVIYEGAGQVFNSLISGLSPNSIYYYRAFANSNQGIGYGEIQSIRTLPEKVVLALKSIDNKFRTSAKITAEVVSLFDSAYYERGIVWSTEKGFLHAEGHNISEKGVWDNPGEFIVNLTEMPGPGMFYFKLFAKNSAGVTYSDEIELELENSLPNIDLDANNNRGLQGNDYMGVCTEQLPGATICDVDVKITDPDGDMITKAVIKLLNPQDSLKEYLEIPFVDDSLIITGDGTHELTLQTLSPRTNQQWEEILKKVNYRNNMDAPKQSVVRRLTVKIFDGFDYSPEAKVIINIIPVNDPPIALKNPQIEGVPYFGSTVGIIPGLWEDELDECVGEMTFKYKWQVKGEDGTISIIDQKNSSSLSLYDYLCGKSVRVVEEVTDSYCGGGNMAKAEAFSDWYTVLPIQQTISIDAIPMRYCHEKWFTLSGKSSSGLPLVFSVFNDNVISISGDTAFTHNAGAVVLTAVQPGNACYEQSAPAHKIVTVARGNQQIIVDETIEAKFHQYNMKLPAHSTSGLPLEVTIGDTGIVRYDNDTLYFLESGTVSVSLSQPGNQNFFQATTVSFNLVISKGDQAVSAAIDNEIRYGNGKYLISAFSTSNLDVEVLSSNESIVGVDGEYLIINGVGDVLLTVRQQGNSQWNPANDITVPITVQKGFQEIIVESIGDIYFADQHFIPVAYSTSGNKISLSVADSAVAKVEGGMIVLTGVGETVVDFVQEGSHLWEPTQTSIPLIVKKSNQEIVFEAPTTITFNSTPIILNAYSNSGLPVTYQLSDTTIGSVINGELYVSNAGTFTISAFQEGSTEWEAAIKVAVEMTILRASQQINANLPELIFAGDKFPISLFYASSGLPVEIIAENTSIVQIDNDSIQFLEQGNVRLQIAQAGNRNYEPITIELFVNVSEPVFVVAKQGFKTSVYPNPTEGIVYLKIEGDADKLNAIEVIDLTGRLVGKYFSNKKADVLNLSEYADGVYFIVVKRVSGVSVNKILLRK